MIHVMLSHVTLGSDHKNFLTSKSKMVGYSRNSLDLTKAPITLKQLGFGETALCGLEYCSSCERMTMALLYESGNRSVRGNGTSQQIPGGDPVSAFLCDPGLC